jgi:alanine racemase
MSSATGILKINLDAIASNWNFIRASAPRSEIGAVIKANAYSVGARFVAKVLYDQGCRSFFVTTLDEALEVKDIISKGSQIYVLGGVREGDEAIFVEENLVPVIYSIEMLHRWIRCATNMPAALQTAIKIDTGMSRFGMQIEEFLSEFPKLVQEKNISLQLLMSHLACADEPLHPLNLRQLNKFRDLGEKVKSIIPSLKLSLANSSGIFLGEEWQFDLVRPGAALYGINPQPQLDNPLRQVINLRLPVLQLKEMERDSSVGYSAVAEIKKASRLAIVAGGYADGIHRTLGSQPKGICCGFPVNAIGRVSMDATIFDVTGVQASEKEIFESGIDVINDRITLDDLSLRNGSLGYEVLTGMGLRYQRNYVRD